LVSCATAQPEKKALTPREKAQRLVAVAGGAVVEGDPTGALRFIQQAEAIDASLPELHHVKALALVQKHEPQAAIAAALRAIELKPDFAEANNTLGRLYLEQGRYAEAIPPLKKAASNLIFRESYKADINLGILYYRTGENALARKHFEHATLMAPHFSCMANYYLGHLELRENRPAKAVDYYEKATLRFCGKFADAHLAMGMALIEDKQFVRARKKLLDVYKIFPETQVAKRAMEQMKRIP
jgi:Tfp pilus assembly protein PilF